MANKDYLRRIGVLIPPSNVTCELEFPTYAPQGTRFHFNRLSRPGTAITRESLLAMMRSTERAAEDVACARPEVIVYACTSGSFLDGPTKHRALAERIEAKTGIPAVTTSTAVVEALQAVGASTAFMVTPYPANINNHEVEFLEANGIRCPAHDSFLYPDSFDIRTTDESMVRDLVLKNRDKAKECGAVFISCTNLRTMARLAEMEAELGIPVISSNSATVWAGLSRMGIDTSGIDAGRLFRTLPETGRQVA
ncbi:MAG: aspartate/glutamate racemase family protein [Acetobacterales bacterium]